MRFGEPHPYPERGSHTDGASRGNRERVIVYKQKQQQQHQQNKK
jgi:hypothetical protein